MDKARRGREDFTFFKELSEVREEGRRAGKTPLDIDRDKKKIYQEFFDWAYGEADQWAHRAPGPHFKNRLDDMDRYGALAGLLPFDIARLKQTIFKTLYETSLKKLKSDLQAKGCNNPDKEIIFGAGFLEIQGVNRSEILAYGA